MSGTYYTVNEDAPGGLNETAAAVASGVASAAATNAAYQSDAESFLVQYGGAVVDGHAPVGDAPDH